MVYVVGLPSGQQLTLENHGHQTTLTLAQQQTGQQQSQRNSFMTGPWTDLPQVFQTAQGAIARFETAQGIFQVQIVGSAMAAIAPSPIADARELPLQVISAPDALGMQPMQPMQPLAPMSMSMGNLEMHLAPRPPEPDRPAVNLPNPGRSPMTQRFCTQCGEPVEKGDRFCGACGHPLRSPT